ncbi:Clavaminate synthase-like protein [Acephala macrosclerotiorum]|nr:Clavaminate synthase-like protein [Acephala macrosclerotiorum]
MAPSLDVLFPSTGRAFTEPDSNPSEPYYSYGLRERFRIDGLKPLPTDPQPEANADIGYDVDEAKYLARGTARIKAGGLQQSVPEGWPQSVSGPLVWTNGDFKDEAEYVYLLTKDDKAEIVEALKYFKELDGEKVSRSTFPLPNLGKQLDKTCEDVYDGRGFAIIRGLDPDVFSTEDLTVVYLGMSSYVGERRGKQDQRGSMLMHVIKRNDESGSQYNLDKPFHTDTVTDCLCLFTRSLAAAGGQSILASSWTVYNELAATRPDIIHVLSAPDWPFDTFGRDPPYYKRALMYNSKGKIIVSFSRRLLVGHEPHESRTEGIPGLTEAQAEALDAVHFIAKKHEISTSMVKGDIRFVNNMGILHRREAFENSERNHRHLIRVWLNNENMCWKLPLPLRIAWSRVFDDEERQSYWDIEPPRKNGVILRVAGTCD